MKRERHILVCAAPASLLKMLRIIVIIVHCPNFNSTCNILNIHYNRHVLKFASEKQLKL